MTDSTAPRAKRIDHRLTIHGHERRDPYYWLREREDPEVLAHLEAENAHTREQLAHTVELQSILFDEIVGRLKPDDSSVPYRKNGFYYYHRFEDGGDYPLYCRRKGFLEAEEEILLDGNAMAAGHSYFSIGGLGVSSDSTLLAYATDVVGRRIYSIRFKNLVTGEAFGEQLLDATGDMAWAEDGATLLYCTQDGETLRSNRILSHRLGTDSSTDRVVFEETDETFSCQIFKTKSKRYLMVASEQTVSSEYRYCEAENPNQAFRVFLPRQREHEYEVEHHGNYFYIRTNSGARNFRMMRRRVHASDSDSSQWEQIVPHRAEVFLEDFAVFQDHLVLEERRDGLPAIRIIRWTDLTDPEHEGWDRGHCLSFDEATYSLRLDHNPEMHTRWLRFRYSSPRTPGTTYEQDMETGERRLLKQDEVVGSFREEDYATERLSIRARDGEQVPISLVYHQKHPPSTETPLLLYAYGSYGYPTEASFSSARLSLLDRGFVYAIAHIRGGSEKGRSWYDGGKLLDKKNTFTDFIDANRALVSLGYADPAKMYAHGGSAGGLLVGAVINMAPDDFAGAVAEVPFVDVVTTMLDASIPLTTGEYDEWGDPNEPQYYHYMLSYSPYDNVRATGYPHLLAMAGLHDSQVQYWEPAKWVAKLRATKTDQNRLLLHTNLDAGHSGASGRYRRHHETALVYAFLLDLAGISASSVPK